ncbi:ATP-binding cassette domain-containing protein [Clostridium sp. YIM B02515]|uniref:ATP-binding cassette domain-containing protein n=1 Tax=Clostridium rhizosphaerae TaxID=2803861 RepID=A0ABS1T4W9_9CLOT|nr:ATP-binding cassette domain-containing protein [Clostridium rhizosphaerae]MBL4934381.1 ATP-binding cassette domain-containing protein [Clostridium rhizosphaerae]
MTNTVIKTKNLTKKYRSHLAVDNADLEIKQGEVFGLVGKNGAGKTTLLRMITGLTMPTSGEIELFQETSNEGLNKSRMRTGSIIETPSFFPYLSARKNLEYYRIQRGIAEKDVIDDTLKIVGLDNTGNKKFKNFSLGMKQRLGLALAIMASPDLLILDEPINGLDPTGIVEFRDILLKLNRERNITIIISSHILSELAQLATSFGFINDGRFIEQISAKDLEEKCRSSVSVKVSSTEKASAVIEKQLGSTKYEVLNGNEIRIYDYINKPEVVAEAMINNGIKLYSLNQLGANLENYFIDLIGGNKHA